MGQFSGTKILVIDDEIDLLHSLTAYLADSGFIVFGAENGCAGIELFTSEQPSLVLTDIHMPEMSGLEVLSAVNKLAPEVPVIVISGAGELNDAIAALRLGAWDFLTKPITDLNVLEHAINKALDRKNLLAQNKEFAAKIADSLHKLEEDQVAGRSVQMSMLPQAPLKAHGYTFSYKIYPSLELSGDFVEYFAITEDLFGVYVADVSGHGASSAFVTVSLKSLIGQHLASHKLNSDDTILSPVKLMQALSKEIYAAKLGKYLTMIYGVLNSKAHEFTYVVGGHYPGPILLTSNGMAEFQPGSGLPVGVMPKVDYVEHKLTINPGDSLVMLSDGILEVMQPGASLEDKEQLLLKIVSDSKANLESILATVGVSADKTQDLPDDVTILLIECDK